MLMPVKAPKGKQYLGVYTERSPGHLPDTAMWAALITLSCPLVSAKEHPIVLHANLSDQSLITAISCILDENDYKSPAAD